MIDSLNQKVVSVTPPAAIVNNAAFTTGSVDTLDAEHVDIIFYLGATDIAFTAVKLQESDDNATWVDVPNSAFGTGLHSDGTASTLPTATDDNHIFGIHVDMRGRKRYLKPGATIGNGVAGGFLAILAILSRLKTTPSDAAGKGFTQELYA